MHQIDTELLSADPVQRLHLTQERIDLHAEQLRLVSGAADVAELEKAFVRVARGYGDRHEISYSAWRQVGVAADVLAAAGVKPKPARLQPDKAAAAAPAAAPPEAEVEVEADPTLFKAAAKKAPAKKVAVKKVASAAKKNGATRSVKKAAAPSPSEAHLLS
jgi:hypothetical protein